MRRARPRNGASCHGPQPAVWPFRRYWFPEHRRRGVDLRFGVGVAALGRHGHGLVPSVFEGGDVIACDVVVYGVGVRPRTELAEAAGLAVDNGILANRFLQTAGPRHFRMR
ncbi:FAD-dependent oxidoreductase [Rhizobium yanglingense]